MANQKRFKRSKPKTPKGKAGISKESQFNVVNVKKGQKGTSKEVIISRQIKRNRKRTNHLETHATTTKTAYPSKVKQY